MKKYIPGLLISLVYFFILVFTLPQYGINEDSPFHFLRGQSYLQKILNADRPFSAKTKPSPVFFVPGQRISQYKPSGSEDLSSFAPLRPIGLFQNNSTIQQQHRNSGESFYKHDAWRSNIWDAPGAQSHPAVSDILLALSNRIFYEKLGVVGDVEGYHLYVIFVSSLAVFFVYIFAKKIFGEMAGIFASMSLALFPFFFAEAHFNIKDPVQMSFFTISLISFYFWLTLKNEKIKSKEQVAELEGFPSARRSGDISRQSSTDGKESSDRIWNVNFNLRWYVIWILSTFLALGSKWNIFIMPLIVGPWLLFLQKPVRFFWLKLIFFASVGLLLSFGLLIAAWPFLWTDTLTRLIDTFSFYSGLGIKDIRIQPPSAFPLPLGFDATAVLRIISLTPPLMLILFFLGIANVIPNLFRDLFSKNQMLNRAIVLKARLLLLLWFALPILRASRQEAETLGSIRNFIEFLPAMAIICGVGASSILTKLLTTREQMSEAKTDEKKAKIPFSSFSRSPMSLEGDSSKREKRYRAFLLIGILLYLTILFIPILNLHPNQNLYFNFLVGGLKGAKNLKLYEWQTSYDNVYRQGVTWLNAHAVRNGQDRSLLAHLDGTMLSISPIWLRDDIRYGSFFSGFEKKGEYIVSLVYPDPPPVFAYNYLERFLEPLYTLTIDHVDLLKVWKNDKKYLRPEYISEKKREGPFEIKRYFLGERKVWDLDLGKKERVTRLLLKPAKDQCVEQKGVWSVVLAGKEKFLSLEDFPVNNDTRQIFFPAEPAETIRFWDVQANSCLYNAELKELKILE